MATKLNPSDKEALRRESIEQTVSATDKFFNENKKTIWTVAIAIVVVGLGVLAYSKFVYQPKCAEAMQQMFPAEASFQAGEYELALNGDGNVAGFVNIIEDYGTKAGKAVYLYAGICEYQLGNYEQAIIYLNEYKGKEPILAARALACKGDAYVALEDYKAAVSAFSEAVAKSDNVFAAGYLFKQGLALEQLGDKAAALKCYERISEDYPQSVEAYDIAKYIVRVSE